MVPLLAWMTWRRAAWLRKLWAAVPAAMLGALPSLVWNLRHDFGSFHSTVPDTTTYEHRLRLFVSPLLPLLSACGRTTRRQRIIPSAIATLADRGAARRAVRVGRVAAAAAADRAALPDRARLPVSLRDPGGDDVRARPEVPRRAGAGARAADRAARDHLPACARTARPRGVGLVRRACSGSTTTTRPRRRAAGRPARPRAAGRRPRPRAAEPGLRHLLGDLPARLRHARADHRRRRASSRRSGSGTGVAPAAPQPERALAAVRATRSTRSPRPGFVFFKAALGEATATTAALAAHGYRRIPVGPFVVYAPPR